MILKRSISRDLKNKVKNVKIVEKAPTLLPVKSSKVTSLLIENSVLASDSDQEIILNAKENTLRSNKELERLIIDTIHETLQSQSSDLRDKFRQLQKYVETTINERNLQFFDLEDELQVLKKVGKLSTALKQLDF